MRKILNSRFKAREQKKINRLMTSNEGFVLGKERYLILIITLFLFICCAFEDISHSRMNESLDVIKHQLMYGIPIIHKRLSTIPAEHIIRTYYVYVKSSFLKHDKSYACLLKETNFSSKEIFVEYLCGDFLGLMHIRNLFFNPANFFTNGTVLFPPPMLTDYIPDSVGKNASDWNIVPFESLVITHVRFNCNYGHYLYDTILPLIFISRDLINKSTIILNSCITRMSNFKELIKMIDLGIDKFYFVDSGRYVFGRDIYMIASVEHCNNAFWSASKLRSKIFSYFNVSPKKMFFLVHFRRNRNRYIINQDTVYNFLKTNFSDVSWQPIHSNYSLWTIVSLFSHARLYFSGAGSSLANMAFMPKDSGVVYYLAERVDKPNLVWIQGLQIWALAFNFRNSSHYNKGVFFTESDIEVLRKSIYNVLFAVDHSRWPGDICLQIPIHKCHNHYNTTLEKIKKKFPGAYMEKELFFYP